MPFTHRRNLAKQRDRIRMVRLREEVGGAGALDNPAEIHDHDAVADMLHHADVVADEEVSQAKFALEVEKLVEDLRLDRNVERGDRLVADDEAGLDRQRPGDADPLPLTAG